MSGADVVVLGSANLDLIASVSAIPAPGVTVLAGGRESALEARASTRPWRRPARVPGRPSSGC